VIYLHNYYPAVYCPIYISVQWLTLTTLEAVLLYSKQFECLWTLEHTVLSLLLSVVSKFDQFNLIYKFSVSWWLCFELWPPGGSYVCAQSVLPSAAPRRVVFPSPSTLPRFPMCSLTGTDACQELWRGRTGVWVVRCCLLFLPWSWTDVPSGMRSGWPNPFGKDELTSICLGRWLWAHEEGICCI
jgi:hypothetical protein